MELVVLEEDPDGGDVELVLESELNLLVRLMAMYLSGEDLVMVVEGHLFDICSYHYSREPA